MNRARAQSWLFAATLILAIVLQLMPLPAVIAPLKPYWLALVLIYWGIEVPERATLGFALLLGLASDVLTGQLLGEQAMRLVMLTFIVLRFRARLRFFPMWQQTLAVMALLTNDRIVVAMIDGFAGRPTPPAQFWLAPAVGAAIWPFLFVLLDDLRARLRARDA
ncbi:MAG: rod shape-determining protein MreD [Dokdonella sp.]